MVAKMRQLAIRDRFMKRIRAGAIYEITGLCVCEGGESVHIFIFSSMRSLK